MSAIAYRHQHAVRESYNPIAEFIRGLDVALVLGLALVAFEFLSFEMSRYGLNGLLSGANFAGFGWATILAVAFCCIDFAGLLRFFMAKNGQSEPAESWYWMGAWLLGATLHALLAWWATSLILVNFNSGSSGNVSTGLIAVLPVSIAVLVWIARILFIGAFTFAGRQEHNKVSVRPVRSSSSSIGTKKALPTLSSELEQRGLRLIVTDQPVYQYQEKPPVKVGSSKLVDEPTILFQDFDQAMDFPEDDPYRSIAQPVWLGS